MSKNATNTYDFDIHVAEIYDQVVKDSQDIDMILRLIAGRGPLRILEPFCGTGRILIPLAMAGHEVVGIDQAATMLDWARRKVAQLTPEVQRRITLIHADATASTWPAGFDVVLLASNCFYELACPREQEACVAAAAAALKPDGYVLADSDHMEGELAESWRHLGKGRSKFPCGICRDGVRVEGATETIWCDVPRRLVRFRRTISLTFPDGRTASTEWIQQKHPVSTGEVQGWLREHGLVIEQHYGHAGEPYTEASSRTTLWARKPHTADMSKSRPESVVIRMLRPADFALLSGIAELSIIAWTRQPTVEEIEQRTLRLEQSLQDSDPDAAAAFVAQRAGRIVGFGRVARDKTDASQWLLFALVVHPEHRRQGIARLLAQTGIDYARQRGARCICSQTHIENVASIDYHESMGFVRGDLFVAPDGDRIVPFRLELD